MASISAAMSSMPQTCSLTPAAIAGETPLRVLCYFTKLYQTVYSATMWQWFSNFFEKALVASVDQELASRVDRHVSYPADGPHGRPVA